MYRTRSALTVMPFPPLAPLCRRPLHGGLSEYKTLTTTADTDPEEWMDFIMVRIKCRGGAERGGGGRGGGGGLH